MPMINTDYESPRNQFSNSKRQSMPATTRRVEVDTRDFFKRAAIANALQTAKNQTKPGIISH